MKKQHIIFSLVIAACSIAAFGFINQKGDEVFADQLPCKTTQQCSEFVSIEKPDFDFAYIVEPRFYATVSMEELKEAKSILEIMPERDGDNILSYHNIQISTFLEDRNKEQVELGKDEFLTAGQRKLIEAMDYSSSFFIVGNVMRDNGTKSYEDTLVTYFSIAPKHSAQYSEGNEAMINYLKENSVTDIAIARKDKMQPGKISFTVTYDGKIKDARISESSGYDSIDQKMLRLIAEMPGSWEPGMNSYGVRVDQALTFFFGFAGC